MLKVDSEKLTKNLKFNISPGSFKGRKVMFPAHRTKNEIVGFAFKLTLKDVLNVIIHRRLYVQQVPNGKKAAALTVDVTPVAFEQSVQENEDFFEKQKLEKVETKEAS